MPKKRAPVYLRHLINTYLSWCRSRLAPSTCGLYRMHLERFFKKVGNVDVSTLLPFHLMEWESRWNPLQAVKRLFSWAKLEAGIIRRNPFKKVKLPPTGMRRRVLTKAEQRSLLREARSDFKLYLLALRETIARPQEIRAVTWEDLRGEHGEGRLGEDLTRGACAWVLEDFKGRKRRSDTSSVRCIPVSPLLGRVLAWMLRTYGPQSGPCFLTAGKKPWTNNKVRLRMARLRLRAGLEADRRGERVVCYSFRHSGATEASALGLRDRLLADMMGHSTTRTTARYQHLQTDHITKAMQDLVAKRKERRDQKKQ